MPHQRVTQPRTAKVSHPKGGASSIKPLLPTRASGHLLLQLQQTIGNQAVQRLLQAKLKIGLPGDQYEQEADRVADQVMRLPDPQLQRACPCGGGCPKCQTEQLGQEHEHIQTRRVQASDAGETSVLPIVHEVLRSPGQPLDPATHVSMESRFGHDFSSVRMHTDARAAQSARTANALAYTVGHDIVFGAGQYAPGTAAGRKLIAHEVDACCATKGQEMVTTEWGRKGKI